MIILGTVRACLQVKHRKFQDGDWADLQLRLQRDPARPAYKLGVRYESPGIFYLGFVLRNTPQRENFSVLPSGFYFRKKVRLAISLLSWHTWDCTVLHSV